MQFLHCSCCQQELNGTGGKGKISNGKSSKDHPKLLLKKQEVVLFSKLPRHGYVTSRRAYVSSLKKKVQRCTGAERGVGEQIHITTHSTIYCNTSLDILAYKLYYNTNMRLQIHIYIYTYIHIYISKYIYLNIYCSPL